MTTQILITPTAFNRIEEIRSQKSNSRLYLRITVSGGGCSGFKYDLGFDDIVKDDDKIFDECVITDDMSLGLLSGSTIDYVVNMMGENFKITNPNASSGCGCGESFSV
jgi:iron-sulfur cluster insertion protein